MTRNSSHGVKVDKKIKNSGNDLEAPCGVHYEKQIICSFAT
jgi:hypothetical protein